MTAGSDAHTTKDIVGGAMRFPYEINDMAELIAAIRRRDGEIVEKMK